MLFLKPSKRTRASQAKGMIDGAGYSTASPTHSPSGQPTHPPIVHTDQLRYLLHHIEIYLSRNIYPGARLQHPRLGGGTVVVCRLHRPYQFGWIPDSDLEDEMEDMPNLKYFDPEDLAPGWQFPTRGLEDWVPFEVDSDTDIVDLTGDQRQELVHLSRGMSTWQMGRAIEFLLKDLREKARGGGGES